VASAATATEAMVLLEDAPYDVVLLDIWLPDRDGLDVLADIHRQGAAMRLKWSSSAATEPSRPPSRPPSWARTTFLRSRSRSIALCSCLKNAVEARRHCGGKPGNSSGQFSVGSVLTGESVADESPAPGRFASWRPPTDACSSTAVGHRQGNSSPTPFTPRVLRRDQIFVEPQLRRHSRGAHRRPNSSVTARSSTRRLPEQRGTLERADGGTLFLDEVGDMSLKTQSKMLSALDDQQFTPVGGHAAHSRGRAPYRLHNKDLEEEIAKGNFREDLFYRLNVVPFFVPPLRERKQDIPPLTREFLAEFGRQYGRPRMEIAEDALERCPIPLAGQRARTQRM